MRFPFRARFKLRLETVKWVGYLGKRQLMDIYTSLVEKASSLEELDRLVEEEATRIGGRMGEGLRGVHKAVREVIKRELEREIGEEK